MSENSMSDQMRATLKEVDELKRDLSDDEERCAQTAASAQVVQQQLAEFEQRADADIRQTQQDLQTVRETLLALSGETQAVQTTSGDASTSTSAGSSSCQPPQGPGASSDNEPSIVANLMTPAGLPMQGVIVQGMLSAPGLIASVVGAPIILPSAGTLAAGGSSGGSGVAAMPPPPARPPSNRSTAAPSSSSGSNEALPPRKANLGPSAEDEAREGASSSEEAQATPSVEDTEMRPQQRGGTN